MGRLTNRSLFLLKDKCILITGGGQRIGAAVARYLHGKGARVVLHYRHSRYEAETLAAGLNDLRADSAIVAGCDLCDTANLNGYIERVLQLCNQLDALINNASSFYPTPLGEINEENWQDLTGSNFKAPLFLAQACAPHLRATAGAIVNITDIHAEWPLPGYPLYSAAKGALLTLTRALAIELAPQVRVNAIAPGAIMWPDNGLFAREERQAIIDHSLLKRMGTPDDVARTAYFLLAKAHYITGQIINVDGGRSIHL